MLAGYLDSWWGGDLGSGPGLLVGRGYGVQALLKGWARGWSVVEAIGEVHVEVWCPQEGRGWQVLGVGTFWPGGDGRQQVKEVDVGDCGLAGLWSQLVGLHSFLNPLSCSATFSLPSVAPAPSS